MEITIYAKEKWELLAALDRLVQDAKKKDGAIDTLKADFQQLADDYKGGE